MNVHKKDFPKTWAFTVDSGEILNINSAVIFKHNEIEYALNGIASSRGYEPLGKLWKSDPSRDCKVSITSFIELGNKI